MSRLNDLLKAVEQANPQLALDLRKEVSALSSRRAFGLNFERHAPESMELPGRPVRRGDKVRILPPRDDHRAGRDHRLWLVLARSSSDSSATVTLIENLAPSAEADPQVVECAAGDVVVVAESTDRIYPGLISTGAVARGGDKPFHSVINADNLDALRTLLFTHEQAVDAIYIDPPYNSGARDWKYNNDYVDADDDYRHSKWLAFMERRLKIASRLLNPDNGVLIVTIDEKEYLRLGLLLEQTFPDATIQMVTSVINRKGVPRKREFSRVDEFIYFVMLGEAAPAHQGGDMLSSIAAVEDAEPVTWIGLRRRGSNWRRSDRPGSFYPIFVDETTGTVLEFGQPLPLEAERASVPDRPGCLTIWPINSKGQESRWQLSPETADELFRAGYLKTTWQRGRKGLTMEYLSEGQRTQIENGTIKILGKDAAGAVIAAHEGRRLQQPKTVWNQDSHGATAYGTQLVSALVPGRSFPFPKSLYAVEDTLRFFIGAKPNAVVLDFFSGSGTTAHAVMRLNRQDGGSRQCISVTNNEVSPTEHRKLRSQGLRAGDPDWERWGICDYITKPRIRSAIEGTTPEGEPIKGDYKGADRFPMSEGFEENVEFFTLTYEARRPVAQNRAFGAIAPLLWLRAGASGRRIDERVEGFAAADTYAILFDLDFTRPFLASFEIDGALRIAYVVTDDESTFQAVARGLPPGVEAIRLYESYLTNFTFNAGVES